MKFYVLDDNISSVRVLSNIVESRNLGTVIGKQTDSEKAIREIPILAPDIVLIDLLMPKKDGISVVSDLKPICPGIDFIMVSQVIDKSMISDAYRAGVEFYITKPNDAIEIETVIKRVIEKRQMSSLISGIRTAIGHMPDTETPGQNASSRKSQATDTINNVKMILGSIGMLGEGGTKDIINIFQMLLEGEKKYSKDSQSEYALSIGEDVKVVKQRIRRAIKKGLTNTAAMGIEDYYSDNFDRFAHTLYNFDAVRTEMDLLRGKSLYGGRPSVEKFFEGLQVICELSEE